MRWFPLAAVALAGAGCWSTTTVGSVSDDRAQRWLAENASSDMNVAMADLRPDQNSIALQATSPTDIRFLTREGWVPIDDVRRLTVVKRGRGMLDGALLGVGIGALGGYLQGLTSNLSAYEQSMDCTIICNKSDAANWGALAFGVLGLLAGTITGAVVGHRDILELH
jgi:hypothetical protein